MMIEVLVVFVVAVVVVSYGIQCPLYQ
jgi:hypothetical protein